MLVKKTHIIGKCNAYVYYRTYDEFINESKYSSPRKNNRKNKLFFSSDRPFPESISESIPEAAPTIVSPVVQVPALTQPITPLTPSLEHSPHVSKYHLGIYRRTTGTGAKCRACQGAIAVEAKKPYLVIYWQVLIRITVGTNHRLLSQHKHGFTATKTAFKTFQTSTQRRL